MTCQSAAKPNLHLGTFNDYRKTFFLLIRKYESSRVGSSDPKRGASRDTIKRGRDDDIV